MTSVIPMTSDSDDIDGTDNVGDTDDVFVVVGTVDIGDIIFHESVTFGEDIAVNIVLLY
jgi:hypothetical protein